MYRKMSLVESFRYLRRTTSIRWWPAFRIVVLGGVRFTLREEAP